MQQSRQDFVECVRHLRRYAHALMGTPQRGDTYVAACLEVVSAEPHLLSDGDLKLELFKLFHTLWQSVDARCPEPVTERDAFTLPWDNRPPLRRQILLLRLLEKFSTHETADIIGISEARVQDTVSHAREELHDRLTYLIEDVIYGQNLSHPRRTGQGAPGMTMVLPRPGASVRQHAYS